MNPDIPTYSFHNNRSELGFEILSLEYLLEASTPSMVEIPHRVDFYIIVMVTKGEGQHIIDFTPYRYEPGSIFFIAKNQVTSFGPNPDAEGFVVLFDEAFYQQNQINFNELFYSYPFNVGLYAPLFHLNSDKHSFIALFNAVYKEYENNAAPQAEEVYQCFLRILFLKISMVHKQFQHKQFHVDQLSIRLFIQFQKMVDDSLASNRNAVYFCDCLGVSFKKLNAICKKLTQKTVKEYIDERLVLEAKRALTYQQANISEIAYSLGFEEVTNFTKYFKRHVHQSPLEFRQSL
jgi:AraC-like DNA-binding protein